MATVNWNNPTNSTTYTSVLGEVKDRDENLGKMSFTSDTNVPDGFVRLNTSNSKLEIKNGGSWDDGQAWLTSHVANTSNPHSVTAAQVGNTTAQWNANQIQGKTVTITSIADNDILAYNSGTDQYTNQDASELGLATSASLSSHTSSTSNPHSVTAAQAGAFAISNNLSEGTAATIRTNIGAAVSGSNGDITALTNCPSISDNAAMTLGPTNSNTLTFRTNNSNRWQIDTSGHLIPASTESYNIGGSSNLPNVIYGRTFNLQTHASAPNNASWTYFGTTSERKSINPTALSGDAKTVAEAVDTLIGTLKNLGVIKT